MNFKVFSDIKEVIFPKYCVFCEELIDKRENYVCENCKKTLVFDYDKICKKCGQPVDAVDGDFICKNCLKNPPNYNRNVSSVKYTEEVRKAILSYKFNGKIWRVKGFAELLGNVAKNILFDYDFDCIIPVPISNLRFAIRGYNQSEIMAKELSKIINVPIFDDVLYKVVNNPAQSALNFENRKENVKGVYSIINENKIEGKSVLLVDDIITSGATLNECSKILKKYGALYVACCTLAYVGE